MWSKASPTPYRYISRRIVGFQMESLKLLLGVFPADLHRAIMFALIARLSSADWIDGEVARRPDRHTAFSVNSLAASLSRPFETVRRHVLAMEKAGVCARTNSGIILSPSPDREPEIIRFYQAQATALRVLAIDLAARDIPLPAADGAAPNALLLMANAALDIGLVALENNPHSNWSELILHGTLIYENARDVMENPELATAYSDKVIPDELRRPVKIRALSDTYGMPYATVRRHIDTMISIGAMQRKRSGYVLKTDWTAEPARLEMSDQTVQYLLRNLRTLAAAGVNLTAPL
jgi:hypothetical protein